METLTLFINDLYSEINLGLGSEPYQIFQDRNVFSETYTDVILSGNLIKEVVFEEVIFENCTFFSTEIENTLFINCLFLNCTFQFSRLTDCNFEGTAFENCKWILTHLKDTDLTKTDSKGSVSYLSERTHSKPVNDLFQLLRLTA